jgi:MATE family multidrug resistance protein
MIFGHWGFPEMGIKGAALATVLSGCTRLVIYLAILFKPSYAQQYHTLKGWRPDPSLFARLIRFGFPNGVQFFIDMAAFTAFVLIMGRLGTVALAATNIAFNINTLAFMPMIGCGIAVSVLVGQSLGRDRPDMAERAVYSGAHLTFLYMTTLALLYVLVPNLFLAPFAAQADADDFGPISTMAVVLLRFVAIYSVFDTLNIVFASGIKGAGDTRFVMSTVVVLSLLGLMLPSYVGLVLLNGDVYVGFGIVTAYVSVLGFVFLFRFLGGKWKSMRVIETPPIAPPQATSERPTSGLGS